MSDPFKVVREFEAALCGYTGAPYAVSTTSCTMALLLAVAWHLRFERLRTREVLTAGGHHAMTWEEMATIEIPKRTYIGVPMSIIHAGGRPTFRDEDWHGVYKLEPLPVWDCARRFTSDMYQQLAKNGYGFLCLSFHWNKILGIQQGGCILHGDAEADRWLRKARFDGRSEGVPAVADHFDVLGYHAYMAPETAAAGLVRLASLPRHNADLPKNDYPDLSQVELFR